MFLDFMNTKRWEGVSGLEVNVVDHMLNMKTEERKGNKWVAWDRVAGKQQRREEHVRLSNISKMCAVYKTYTNICMYVFVHQ